MGTSGFLIGCRHLQLSDWQPSIHRKIQSPITSATTRQQQSHVNNKHFKFHYHAISDS